MERSKGIHLKADLRAVKSHELRRRQESSKRWEQRSGNYWQKIMIFAHMDRVGRKMMTEYFR